MRIIEDPYSIYNSPICNCFINRLGVQKQVDKLGKENITKST